MECTADPCHSPLVYKGGENREDFGCRNPNCRRFEIHYSPNVKVRSNHYFLMGYNLPYTWIDRRTTYGWFALVGSPESGKTELQGLKLVERSYGGHNWNEATQDYSAATVSACVQEVLHTVDYVALPANQDFKRKFYELRDRLMNEWLGEYRNLHCPPRRFNVIDRGDHPIVEPRRQDHRLLTTSATSVSIDSELQRLIHTANTDTNDDAAEQAARDVCRRLRGLLNG